MYIITGVSKCESPVWDLLFLPDKAGLEFHSTGWDCSGFVEIPPPVSNGRGGSSLWDVLFVVPQRGFRLAQA